MKNNNPPPRRSESNRNKIKPSDYKTKATADKLVSTVPKKELGKKN